MTAVEPDEATGIELASALGAGRPLIDRMADITAQLFEANPTVQALYRDVYAALLVDAETIPGFSVAMAMMLERYAFVWATQRAADLADQPLNARDYDQLILRFRQLWDGLLRARDDRQADDAFKRAFTTAFLQMFASACDDVLEPDVSALLQRRVVDKMRAVDVQGTDARRRK